MAINGTLEDNTYGSQFYFNPAGVTQEPSWASVIPFIGQIGDHLFFGSGVSAAIASVQETVTGAYETIEEAAAGAIGVMKENPNIMVLVLAGLGAGLLLVMSKKKK